MNQENILKQGAISQLSSEEKAKLIEEKKRYWNSLSRSKQELIIDSSDEQFEKLNTEEDFYSLIPAEWKFFRDLMKNVNVGRERFLKTFHLKAEDEKESIDSWEEKMKELKFDHTNDKSLYYFDISRLLSGYQDGINSAKTKFRKENFKVRYPTEEEAIKILKELWDKLEGPKPAVACFIDKTETFIYLTKTGEPKPLKEGRPPTTVDTRLFIIVVAEKQ